MKKIKYLNEGKVVKFINDLTFKSVLSDSNCREALCLLLYEVTGYDYDDLFKNIKIINSEHPIIKQGNKAKRSDLIIQYGDIIFILEMNSGKYYDGLFIKNYCYANEVNIRSIKKGDYYCDSKDIYLINIDEYDSFNCNSLVLDFPRYNKENNVLEKINIYDKHVILENVDKDKYNKYSDSFINLIKIMRTDDKFELRNLSEGDDRLEKVVDKIIDLSEDEDYIGLYDVEERHRKEIATVRKVGLDEGHKQGLSEGSKKTQNSIAKNLLKLGMKIEEISKATGLSINQIKML